MRYWNNDKNLSWFVGGTVSDKPFYTLFMRVAIGALLLTTVYAAIITGGWTVMLFVPLLLVAGVCRGGVFPPSLKFDAILKGGMTPPLLFGGVFALFALLRYLQLNDLSGNLFNLHQDYSFYASLANAVAVTGIESTNFDLLHPALQSPVMYHWGDIHLAGLAQLITGNYLNGYIYVAVPMLGGIAVLGIAAVLEKYLPTLRTSSIALLSLAAFAVIGVGVVINAEGLYSYMMERLFDISFQRNYMLVAVVCWSILAKNKVLPLMVGAVIFSVSAPPLLLGCGLYLAVGLWKRHRQSAYWMEVLTVVATAAWLLGFYYFTAQPNPLFESYIDIFRQIGVAAEQKGYVPMLVHATSPLIGLTIHLAVIALLVALMDRERRRLFVGFISENVLLGCFLLGAFATTLLYWFMRDSVQFYYGAIIPLFLVGYVVALACVWKSNRWWRKAVVGTLVLAGLMAAVVKGDFRGTPMNKEFYAEFAQFEGNIGWLDSDEKRQSDNFFVRDANYTVPFTNVRRFRNDYFPLRLDVYDIAYDPDDIHDYSVVASIENSPFYRYATGKGIQKDLVEAQRQFIIEHNIRHIILSHWEGREWFTARGFEIIKETTTPRRGFTIYTIAS